MRSSKGASGATWATTRAGTGGVRKNPVPGGADGEQLDLVAAVGQGARDRERVHHAAARAHGVGEHRRSSRDRPSPPAAPRPRSTARPPPPPRAAPPSGATRPAGRRRCRTRATTTVAVSATRPTAARQLGGGVGVRAVAADDVEQHARGAPVAGRGLEQLQADAEVDHRVRAALGVALGPEVEDDVAVARRRHRARSPPRRAAARARRTPRAPASRRRRGRARAPAARGTSPSVVERLRAGRRQRRGLERGVDLPAAAPRRPSRRTPRRRAMPSGDRVDQRRRAPRAPWPRAAASRSARRRPASRGPGAPSSRRRRSRGRARRRR